ncbi:hypothetical protein CIG19_18955 [Enterobacterales bacterium CwR94]|nr:hypothetical protein CIG19_18955 [Enterobacterales bacterium CwR94]
MIAPIFEVCATNDAVTAVLGRSPVRLYPFGLQDDAVVYPYAVWQNVSGTPENYLGNRPDADHFTIQVDAYGDTAAQVIEVAQVLRDAVETHAHITRWGNEELDPETKRYRYSFDIDWIVLR